MGAEQAFLNDIGSAYLSRAQAPDPRDLLRWKPTGGAWPLLRDVQGRAAGLRRRSAVVDEQQMTWLEGGNPDGDAIVLLHGFAACKENWVPMIPFLVRQYRVIVPDLPGWGESEFRYEKTYGLDHQVERVAHWLEKHVGERVHLVGSSMGGAIASLVAARHPKQIASLVLMNAAGVRGHTASEFEERLLQGENLLVTRSLADVYKLFTLVTERNKRVLATTLAPLMATDMIARRDVNAHLFHQLLTIAPHDALPSIADIRAPTLVMWGEEDRVLHVSCVETLQALIPHATVKRFTGIGHLPMIEAPALTARALHRFWHEKQIGNTAVDQTAASAA